MNITLAKTLFRAWPFPYGHVRVMDAINPPQLPRGDVTTKLKRYDLLFRYDPNSYLGRFVYYRGIFEEKIVRSIEANLEPGMTFIDVGANIGQHTIIAAHLVGIRGTVIAFEPGSSMRARVLMNLNLNELSNVDLRPIALGSAPGAAELYMPDATNDGESTLAKPKGRCQSEVVEIRTLDDEVTEIKGGCVLKIDVEGSEMEVLRGAEKFVRRVRPKAIFVECIDAYLRKFGATREQVYDWLKSAGYDVRVLVRGSWVHVDQPIDGDIMATPSEG